SPRKPETLKWPRCCERPAPGSNHRPTDRIAREGQQGPGNCPLAGIPTAQEPKANLEYDLLSICTGFEDENNIGPVARLLVIRGGLCNAASPDTSDPREDCRSADLL